MPNVIETSDASASTATTYTLGIGQAGQGTINTIGDHDWWRVNLTAGQTYTFALVGETFNGLSDPILRLRDAAGTLLTTGDDTGPGRNASITVTATTTGTYYLDAGAFGDNGSGQYGVSVVQGSRATYDYLMGAGNLIRDHSSWSVAAATGVNVTWSVSTDNPNQTDAQNNPTAFIAPSAAQIAAMAAGLAQFSDVSNITFTRVNPSGTSNDATIRLSSYFSTTDNSGAYAYFPGSTASNDLAGNVNLNNESVSTTSLPVGSYSYFTMLHEIGHAIGLAHPGDYNAGPGQTITYGTHAQFIEDTHQYTVMSYFDESNTTGSFNSYPDTLLMFDILATQQLYGANMAARAGNSIYGFGANTGTVYNFAINTDPVLCIWDGGGVDTLNASGFSQAQRLDLRAGFFSNIGGLTGNVSIAIGATIEHAVGGTGADTLIGNASANTLNGSTGADTMSGLAGEDTYIVDNSGDIVQESINQGTLDWVATTVSYALGAGQHIEKLTTVASGTTNAINLTGNDLAQKLIQGNAGVNRLDGKGGADTMAGLGGNDTYIVDNAADGIVETAGQGTLDWVLSSVNYRLGAVAQVEKLTSTASAGLTNLVLVGNDFAQSLIQGNAGANVLNGRGGSDILQGLGGSDIFIFDSVLGAGNIDTILDFSAAADTIRIDDAVFAGGGLVAGQTITSAQFFAGAAAHDANDRIIYNAATGALIYDSNGNAAGGAVQFATLQNLPSGVSFQDFYVI